MVLAFSGFQFSQYYIPSAVRWSSVLSGESNELYYRTRGVQCDQSKKDWQSSWIFSVDALRLIFVLTGDTKQDLEVGQAKSRGNCCSRPRKSDTSVQRYFGSHCQRETCEHYNVWFKEL